MLLQLLLRPEGMLQRGRAYRAGADLYPIMFPDTLNRPAKGMFAAKVRQHPIQPT